MKNFFKFLGIVTLVATIGFSMAGCKSGDDDSGGGGLTITGLGDYNGKYAFAAGFIMETEEEFLAAASFNMKKQIITGGKISGGSVTLKVWKAEADDKVSSYSGNDTMYMNVFIHNKASYTDYNEDSRIATGMMTVTFKNGVGSGACVIYPSYSGEDDDD